MLWALATILLPWAALAAVNPGLQNATQRFDACQSTPLPAASQQYLDTSFLGQRQSLEVESVNYTFFRFGPLQAGLSGRPLVLLAGLDKTLSDWPSDLLKPLAAAREVLIFDNRGIGDSDDSYTGNYTIRSYAQSTVSLFDALELEQPDVLGWALGGFIAMALAVEYPDAIKRVVVADATLGGSAFAATPAGQAEEGSLQVINPAFAAGNPTPVANYFPDDAAGNAALCRYLALTAAMPQEAVTDEQALRQGFVELDWHGAGGGFVYEGLPNVTNPFLVIAGAKDLQNPVATQVAIFDRVPGAHMLQYADSGHMALYQHATASAAYIQAFLDDMEGDAVLASA